MNRGLVGWDGVRGGVILHRTAPTRVSKFVGGAPFSIPHPFPHRPFIVRAILTCRIAENSYNVGDEIQPQCTDGNAQVGYSMKIRPFELVLYWTTTTRLFTQKPGGSTFEIAAANWDISFLVAG